jgi:hypothetical protein
VIRKKYYPDKNMTVTANFEKRKLIGDAIIDFDSGERYVGPCNSNFDAHGVGTWTLRDGTRYVGNFIKGVRSGHGRIDYADGSSYEGDFLGEAPHGRGVITTAEGRYEGQLYAGSKHGLGKMTFADGRGYEGNFNDDRIDGAGTLTKADGTVVTGNFRETERDGIILVSEPEEAMPPMQVNPVFDLAQSAALLAQEDQLTKAHNRALRRAQIAERVAVGREELHRERETLADILRGEYDDAPEIVLKRAISNLGSLGGLVSIGSLGGLGK